LPPYCCPNSTTINFQATTSSFFDDDAHMVELPVIDDGEFEMLG
jgi:hypothetical protein